VRKIRNSEKQTIASLYLTIQRKKVRTVAYNPAIEKENRDVNSQLSFFIFLFHGGNKLPYDLYGPHE